VARDGARHHAPDVGAARAALAERGCLGVRGAASPVGVGARIARGVRSRVRRGRTLPLSSLARGFTDPTTITLAYHQASLVVEHIVERFGRRRFTACCARLGRGSTSRLPCAGRWASTSKNCRCRSTPTSTTAMGRSAWRWRRQMTRHGHHVERCASLARGCSRAPGEFRGADGPGEGPHLRGRSSRRADAYARADALVPD